ncbi:MAG TPA: hypothetical protein VKV02_01505 [Acidobacteriaceae bacterium]|nr:hypothetical protein [Acidobacteriaceae bacterium]
MRVDALDVLALLLAASAVIFAAKARITSIRESDRRHRAERNHQHSPA